MHRSRFAPTRSLYRAAAFLLALNLCLCATAAFAAGAPESEEDKVIYFLGVAVSRSLADFALSEKEIELMTQGLRDALSGKDVALDPMVYGPQLQSLAQARKEVAVGKERAASQKFLEDAAKAKGAKKTDSGLVYSEIKAGSGASPQPTDKVRVHYHGTLRDGTVFDSSLERGPAEFPLNRVIPCWTEGVAKMKVGGKAKLVCPSDIAYGDRGNPPTIPGGAALVFEVELLEILPN
jgi:FKBP-type peptidyl-prolyl cis-trans isomerase FkpA